MIHKGKIVALRGSWGSGLAQLVVDVGTVVYVPCDNGPTVRAMDACFGDVIGPGHTIDNVKGGHVGREIYYSVDAFGLLEGFTPVEDASDELVAAYRKERRRGKGKVAS